MKAPLPIGQFPNPDDPNYEVRLGIARAKAAERSRRYRAKHRTGAKRGHPKSNAVPAWKAAGASSKTTYYRNLKAETGVIEAKHKANHNHDALGSTVREH